MSALALDTLAVVKRLIAAGFTDQQAEAVTNVVREAQDIDLSNLATKTDLELGLSKICSEMAELKAEMFRAMLAQTVIIIGAVVTLLKMIGH